MRTPLTVAWPAAARSITDHARRGDQPVPIVAIAGPVGSGKSTLAHEVASLLEGLVLATDRYLPDYDNLPMEERDLPERSHLPELATHLRALASGRTAKVPVWSFFSHRREATETIGPAAAVVVEGIHALHESIAPLTHVRVLVEADEAIRWDRLVAREMSGERGWSIEHMRDHFERVAEPTFTERVAGYRAAADLIVQND